MKIAFVRTASNILKYGGYNIQEIGLAKALMPFGVSTDVYARFSNITETCEVENDGHGNSVVVHPLKGKQIYREIMYYPELKKDLLNGGYDMVQLLDDSQMMLPMLFKALKKAGVKTILWQGMYRDFGGKAAHAMQIVYDCLCAKTLDKYSDLKIAKTDAARDYLIEKNYNDIVVLPVGLDKVVYERDEELEKKIDSFKKTHSNILLYIGAIEPRRNPDFLLDIIKKKEENGCGLIIIGKGVSRDNLLNKIKAMKLDNNTMYIESVPNKNLISVFEKTDVLLLPTNYEIYGMVIMEALTFGVPVVSTPEAGPSFLLNDSLYGRCEPLSLDKWSNAIDYYLNNPISQSEKEMRKNYIDSNFRWEKIAPRYYEIVRSLINKQDRLRLACN